jgi:hypothetical protein
MRRAVIVMARGPRPGEVKTRLIPSLGPGGAAGLYRAFLLDVLDTVATVPRAERFLFVHPPGSVAWFEEATARRLSIRPQTGDTLGERMGAAFAELFREGFGVVAMRNSDSPTLPAGRVAEALDVLEQGVDLVLGPDRGGGYCLVGLRAPHAELFEGVPMGTGSVFQETIRRARALGLSLHLLPPWLDVDTPEDLERLKEELRPARRAERALCERTVAFLATLDAMRPGAAIAPRAAESEPSGGVIRRQGIPGEASGGADPRGAHGAPAPIP